MAMTNSVLDLVRSVKINCTCTGDSFEGTGFVCWPSRDRVSISSGGILELGSDLKNLHRGGVCRERGDR